MVGGVSIGGWRAVVAGAVVTLVVGTGLAAAATPAAVGSGEVTTRVPVGPGRQPGHDKSRHPAISADGRFVAFASNASNLVAGDTNNRFDVFVRDLVARVTRRVSVGPAGQQANGGSSRPAISADGRFVAFVSDAANLVAGDTNDQYDVFVRDRKAQVTRRISVGSSGQQSNDYSFHPTISADGRFVAFESYATNLVAGDTNGISDVFLRDRKLQVTRRISVGAGGQQANGYDAYLWPAISAHGRFVAFNSGASNLVAGDTNDQYDVFVRDRKLQVTRRISVGAAGQQAKGNSFSPAISAHGRFVAFESGASNLVAGDTNHSLDVFVRDRKAQLTRRVSVGPAGQQANDDNFDPAISADGRFVAFFAGASNLVAGDTNHRFDVFVRDRMLQVTRRVSVGPGGQQANDGSADPAISAHGRFVAFVSAASNLVPGDTNGFDDVFVRDRKLQLTRRISVG